MGNAEKLLYHLRVAVAGDRNAEGFGNAPGQVKGSWFGLRAGHPADRQAGAIFQGQLQPGADIHFVPGAGNQVA